MDTLRIILVDDSPLYRAALALLLSQCSRMQVIAEAEDGLHALELATQLQPDLLLIDLVMPTMDGLELTRRLKALTPAPRVIVLTLHTPAGYETAALAAGADGFLAKDQVAMSLLPCISCIFAR